MADEKKEMEMYNIPATIRPRYFAFKVFGGWSAAGVMFFLLTRCWAARSSDQKVSADEKVQIHIEATKQAKIEMKGEFEYVLNMLDQKERRLDDAIKSIDSIKTRL